MTSLSEERIKELVRNAVYGGMNCVDVSLSECVEYAIRTAVAESWTIDLTHAQVTEYMKITGLTNRNEAIFYMNFCIQVLKGKN